MGKDGVEKRRKSFSLKCKNADVIEKEAFKNKVKESGIIDKLIEDEYGS